MGMTRDVGTTTSSCASSLPAFIRVPAGSGRFERCLAKRLCIRAGLYTAFLAMGDKNSDESSWAENDLDSSWLALFFCFALFAYLIKRSVYKFSSSK
jgi:hypothetical protein